MISAFPHCRRLQCGWQTDLAVGAYRYSSSTGRAYIFYNDGSYPTGAASADTIILVKRRAIFRHQAHCWRLQCGRQNRPRRRRQRLQSTSTGRAYIFYNDGTYPIQPLR
jgi:hypothetical protein